MDGFFVDQVHLASRVRVQSEMPHLFREVEGYLDLPRGERIAPDPADALQEVAFFLRPDAPHNVADRFHRVPGGLGYAGQGLTGAGIRSRLAHRDFAEDGDLRQVRGNIVVRSEEHT